jgi:hypothetical protein
MGARGGLLRAVGGAESLVGALATASASAARGSSPPRGGRAVFPTGCEVGGRGGVLGDGESGPGRLLCGPGTTAATGHFLAPSPVSSGSRVTGAPSCPVACRGGGSVEPLGSGSVDGGGAAVTISSSRSVSGAMSCGSLASTAGISSVALALDSRWRRGAAEPTASTTAFGGGLGAVCGAAVLGGSSVAGRAVEPGDGTVAGRTAVVVASGADGRGGGACSRAATAGRGGVAVTAIGPSPRGAGGRLPSGGSVSGSGASSSALGRAAGASSSWAVGAVEMGPSIRRSGGRLPSGGSTGSDGEGGAPPVVV